MLGRLHVHLEDQARVAGALGGSAVGCDLVS